MSNFEFQTVLQRTHGCIININAGPFPNLISENRVNSEMQYFASICWLVEDGVIFKKKSERQRWGGLVAIFLDPDGNEFTVVEDHEHYTRASGQTSHM